MTFAEAFAAISERAMRLAEAAEERRNAGEADGWLNVATDADRLGHEAAGGGVPYGGSYHPWQAWIEEHERDLAAAESRCALRYRYTELAEDDGRVLTDVVMSEQEARARYTDADFRFHFVDGALANGGEARDAGMLGEVDGVAVTMTQLYRVEDGDGRLVPINARLAAALVSAHGSGK